MTRSVCLCALIALVCSSATASPDHGVIINPNLSDPYGAPLDRWGDDVRITPELVDYVRPSMTSAPNGDLYVAVEEEDTNKIYIHRSTDGGQTWPWILSFWHGDETVCPCIHYVSGNEDWVFVAYVGVYDPHKLVGILRFDPADVEVNDFHNVQTGIPATDMIVPRICSDCIDYFSVYYLYVVYGVKTGDYCPVMFSRTLDHGESWESPQNITGGSENTSQTACPAITYSDDIVHVAFEKPGWNGGTWESQIWTTKSYDYGSSGTWTLPIQVTETVHGAYHPAIAAEHDGDSVIVAFTREYSTDSDAQYVYSTNDGDTYSPIIGYPWTFGDEYAVDLALTPGSGRFHVAYHRQEGLVDEILYCWAPTDDPGNWSDARDVDDRGWVSQAYPRPTICVDPTQPVAEQACIAWTELVSPVVDTWYLAAYFDAGFVTPIGDLNCDGVVDFDDIQPFVRALAGEEYYQSYHPDCIWMNADCDQDGDVDFDDIAAFIGLLS